MMKSCLGLVVLLTFVAAGDVEDKFVEDGVVSDVLTVAPSALLKATFTEGNEANLGNTLQVSKTSTEPSVQYADAVVGQKYTIAMVDPDAPSRENPRAAQWNHWLVTNVEGEDLKSDNKVDGKVLMKYNGPSPPAKSGPHRYVLIVYKQPRTINSRVSRNRARFDIGAFAKKNKLGNPVAGNFFFAETE
eukprot:GFUD01001317.1.p1 GENE.GFUD01001317.1~~GFUD01001317.1.p1  ORF type:complete len:189 (-),score=60.19 GFUD01001317.1:81-647(-)